MDPDWLKEQERIKAEKIKKEKLEEKESLYFAYFVFNLITG